MDKKNEQQLYVLIDSSGILFHQYFGMKNANFTNTIQLQGKEVDLTAIFGYLKFYKKLQEEYDNVPKENFIHILDAEGGSLYRKNIFPEYKANRSEKEASLIKQKQLLGFFLQALDEKFLQIPNVESDDVIGTLSQKITEQNDLGLIISYDKDLFQLLNQNISLVKHQKMKGEENKTFCFYDQDYVYKHYGFPPETIVDYLAFLGDKSDNIPGVNGIGEVAAKALIKEFVNVEGVLNNLDKLKEKQRIKIETQRDNLILSKKLALIQKDVELPFAQIEDIKPNISEQLKENLLLILKNFNYII